MLLNERARSAISSALSMGTGCSKRPSPIAAVATKSRRTDRVMRTAINAALASAATTATISATTTVVHVRAPSSAASALECSSAACVASPSRFSPASTRSAAARAEVSESWVAFARYPRPSRARSERTAARYSAKASCVSSRCPRSASLVRYRASCSSALRVWSARSSQSPSYVGSRRRRDRASRRTRVSMESRSPAWRRREGSVCVVISRLTDTRRSTARRLHAATPTRTRITSEEARKIFEASRMPLSTLA